jgi:hypothetical protein
MIRPVAVVDGAVVTGCAHPAGAVVVGTGCCGRELLGGDAAADGVGICAECREWAVLEATCDDCGDVVQEVARA